jgi:hypothetical protein
MVVDTVLPHPNLEVKNEYQYKGVIPQHIVWGFANERQWLFARREFRNQCVREALAPERKRSRKNMEFASAR